MPSLVMLSRSPVSLFLGSGMSFKDRYTFFKGEKQVLLTFFHLIFYLKFLRLNVFLLFFGTFFGRFRGCCFLS